jgi:hypothetical protein
VDPRGIERIERGIWRRHRDHRDIHDPQQLDAQDGEPHGIPVWFSSRLQQPLLERPPILVVDDESALLIVMLSALSAEGMK